MNRNISFTLTLKQTMKTMRSIGVYYPFLFYASFQLSAVMAITYFAYPPFSAILIPLFRRLFGEQAIHYPNNFIILNPLFEWFNIVLSGFLGVLMIGSGTLLFLSHYQNKPLRFMNSLKRTRSKYLKLFIVWFFETLILLGVLLGIPLVLTAMAEDHPTIAKVGSWIIPFLAIFVGAMFAYTTAGIMIGKDGIFQSIKRSFLIFLGHPLVSYAIIGIPAIILLPLELLKSKSALLVTKFFPEVVLALVIIGIFLSVFANCWMVGTVTKYYLSLIKEPSP